MIIIGIVGDIGSGKSYVAKQFGYPVFNADNEVTKIYKNSKYCFRKLKDKLPKYIKSFPVNKTELMNAILANKKNIYTKCKIEAQNNKEKGIKKTTLLTYYGIVVNFSRSENGFSFRKWKATG